MSRDFKIETLDDLKYWTGTITRCLQTCLITGLLKPNKTCVCGQQMHIRLKSPAKHKLDEGYCYYCNNCKGDTSIRVGSIFERSSKSLSVWIDLL